MRLTHFLIGTAILSAGAIAHADNIIAAGTGLSGIYSTETFTSALAENAVAGSNFAGVTFGAGNYVTGAYDGTFPNMVGTVLSNFSPCCTTPTTMTFASNLSGAAFNYVSNDGESTFTAYLGATQVASFTATTGYGGEFYGFQNVVFNSIKIDSGGVNNAYIIDNLQTAPVPEPETYAMLLGGLGLLALVRRRRAKQA
ncbi:PEP-CTERM sorting domain-containing protein [Duganella sp. S19_KUP01_CR8]|uniref:PEP-CTERM sorting domain-containing protein n=1 Tax=Duganella sp. S19_KUP01_CR8 TaxID=3025502 RepID=UPI002FCDD0DF